jgi:hypothetical protein
MEEKMASCHDRDDYASCIRSLGWHQPLFEDEKFKPRMVFRK